VTGYLFTTHQKEKELIRGEGQKDCCSAKSGVKVKEKKRGKDHRPLRKKGGKIEKKDTH